MNFNKKLLYIFPEDKAEKLGGIREYYTQFNLFSNPWGTEFNSQKLRTQIFDTITDLVKVDLIVETGTFRGTTTEYISKKVSCPIYTVELSIRFYTFSKLRFKKNKNVTVFNNDSRVFLNNLSKEKEWKDKTIFFYLDAHWNADLPLNEELDIIFSNWENAIVLVDDFKVENDEGYNYDEYDGVVLGIDYLKPLKHHNLHCYFPVSSELETGFKRGSIIITNNNKFSKTLDSIKIITKYS